MPPRSTAWNGSMPDDGIDRDELYEVVLVVNGSLGMGAGKIAGQAFQFAMRLCWWAPYRQQLWEKKGWADWAEGRTRTIVKIAKTADIFKRVCEDVDGFTMADEGFTEVDAGAETLFVSCPFLHKDRPGILDNKKVKLLVELPAVRHVWSELITERKVPARVCGKCGECWYENDPEPTSECIPTPTHDRHRLKLLERDQRRYWDAHMQSFGISMLVREGETPDEEKVRLRVELERADRMRLDGESQMDALLIALKDVEDLPEDALEICEGYWGDPLW